MIAKIRAAQDRKKKSRAQEAPRAGSAGVATPLRRALAWGVHFYTATGLILAAAIAVLLVRGGPGAFVGSFVLLFLATLVDATDGTLARMVRIKEVLPGFDGRRLDDITDFLTYTFLPLLLVWRAEILPGWAEPVLLLPLLASAYGFCQVEVKTDDGYFLGFPSLWNVVAFYLYLLPMPGWAAVAIVVGLALMTFVPSRYLYPSQPGRLNMVSNVLGAIWAVQLVALLAFLPAKHPAGLSPTVALLAWSSLFYPAYYMVASWAETVRIWTRGRA